MIQLPDRSHPQSSGIGIPQMRGGDTRSDRRFSPLIAAAISLIAAAPTFASSVSAQMSVSVNVVSRAVLQVASQPAVVTVTDADIARGYIDLADPIVVEVRANSPAGYLLQATKDTAGLGDIELAFEDATLVVRDGESWISRPSVPGGEVITMHARVHLDQGTLAGSYPLPLALSARPL